MLFIVPSLPGFLAVGAPALAQDHHGDQQFRHGIEPFLDLPIFGQKGDFLTIAPTGSGKGVSAVIPNLLDYPGSVPLVHQGFRL
jgi:hypothetical protein